MISVAIATVNTVQFDLKSRVVLRAQAMHVILLAFSSASTRKTTSSENTCGNISCKHVYQYRFCACA